jgi:hypothetical protein
MPQYHKSRYLPDPVVYVQDDGYWSSYAPTGVIRQSKGTIPDSILNQTVEIDPAEADGLIARRMAEAERVEVQRAQVVGVPSYLGPGPTGLGGFMIVAIVWLVFTIFGGVMLYGMSTAFVDSGLISPMLHSGNFLHHPLWVPLIIFDFLAAAVLFVMPIVILVFTFQRKRIARRLMIVFCGVALLVAVVNLVMAASFGIDTLRASGHGNEADAVIAQQIYSMIGAVLGAAVFLPYFIVSKRVKNTLVNPRPAAAAGFAAGPMAPRPVEPWPAAPGPSGPGPIWRPVIDGRFCTRCGSYQQADARYCSRCGAELPGRA